MAQPFVTSLHLKSSELLAFTYGKWITNQSVDIVRFLPPNEIIKLGEIRIVDVLNGMLY